MTQWVDAAIESLIETQDDGSGWSYRPGAQAAVEPTVLAGLGLLGNTSVAPQQVVLSAAQTASRWVSTLQHPDGSVSNLAGPASTWATPYAMLLWRAVGEHSSALRLAEKWLLRHQGETFPREPSSPIGHDTTIAGWPWVGGTHSWLEPTAVAVLALQRQGLHEHRRTRDGLRLIADRAIGTGGWNYGNTIVFDRPLRPRPGPTGLALLALACAGEQAPTSAVRAFEYLEEALPEIRSAQSLCWGLLGLAAWGRRPAGADRWLAETYQRVQRRGASAAQVAYLLLAAGERTLEVLGVGRSND